MKTQRPSVARPPQIKTTYATDKNTGNKRLIYVVTSMSGSKHTFADRKTAFDALRELEQSYKLFRGRVAEANRQSYSELYISQGIHTIYKNGKTLGKRAVRLTPPGSQGRAGIMYVKYNGRYYRVLRINNRFELQEPIRIYSDAL
jgi:hypothetical protein